MNLDVEYVKYSIFQLRILRKVLIAVSLILFSISFAISSLSFVALRFWDANTLAWPINQFYDLIAMMIYSCVFVILSLIFSVQIGRVEIVALKKNTKAVPRNNFWKVFNPNEKIELQTLMKFKKNDIWYKLLSLAIAASIISGSILDFPMKSERILIVAQVINVSLCFMIFAITVRTKFYAKYVSE